MKIFFDTSVLVAALVEQHPNHIAAFPWLQKIRDKTSTGFVSAHSIAELYSVLTVLPIRPRILPAAALQAIRRDVLDRLQVVSFTHRDYAAVIEHSSSLGIVGGAIFDALILHAAMKANADQVVTFNVNDFRRVYPQLADKITLP